MRTIFSIFRKDLRGIYKHFFVLVVCLGICGIPALYAWTNIYACWDPYVKTEELEIAVASRDRGLALDAGGHANSANEIIADLRKDKKYGWKFPDTPEEAIDGVRSGKYFAAVIFEDGFTYDMHHYDRAVSSDKAPITYYSNEKNALGHKITDSAVKDLLKKINTQYLKTMFFYFFENTGELADTLDSDKAVDNALKELKDTRKTIHDYNVTIDLVLSHSENVHSAISSTDKHVKNLKKKKKIDTSQAKSDYRKARKAVTELAKSIDKKLTILENTINDLNKTLDQLETLKTPEDEAKIRELVKKVLEYNDKILTTAQQLRAELPKDPETHSAKLVADTLDLIILHAEAIDKELRKEPLSIKSIPSTAEETAILRQLLTETLVPAYDTMEEDISTALKQLKPLLSSSRNVLNDIAPVLGSTDKTITTLDTALIRLKETLTPLEDRLNEVIDKVEDADTDDRRDLIIDLMGGDPDRYSDFFSSMVKADDTNIYPVNSYGEAMAPFYTIIGLWVGAVTMTILLKTRMNRRRYPHITETQSFFGRYMIFFLISQIQAAIVVAGDIFLLGCTPVHPWLMWLSAAVTNMVFSLLIYALALAFGNIGRAVVFIVMFIQVSGSSGTYPIEVLPKIYESIFKFFPFPYAINAMREAICGTYDHDFVIYLVQLMPFAVLGLLVGLFIRRPFVGVLDYMTDKMNETGVL